MALVNPNDLDGDGEDDHLTETKHKIDDYIAKQVKRGVRGVTRESGGLESVF